MRCVSSTFGVALCAALPFALFATRSIALPTASPGGPDSLSSHVVADTLRAAAAPDTLRSTGSAATPYRLPAVVVRAKRPDPRERLERLPGQLSVVELQPLRQRLATVTEALQQLPGLHVNNYGGLGAFSTVSIRGAGSNQVSVYLDGIPLMQAGGGIIDVSELPFTGVQRLEVYRGFAPPEFPGASMGGVINLVTRSTEGPREREPRPDRGDTTRAATTELRRPPAPSHMLLGGTGSFGMRRFGASQPLELLGCRGLLIGGLLQSRADFDFFDDNGTPLNAEDDEVTRRRNNAQQSEELLGQLTRPLRGGGLVTLANQWRRQQRGVPGISSNQSLHAELGLQANLSSLDVSLQPLAAGRLRLASRLYHEWRRDSFTDLDLQSKIGLLPQDNRDVTRSWGGQASVRAAPSSWQQLSVDLLLRRESFLRGRFYPEVRIGPEQARRALELAVEQRLSMKSRLDLYTGWRASVERDIFSGDLKSLHSKHPAPPGSRTHHEPRLGARLQIASGLVAKATYGRYHRAPRFLELFGDGGVVTGSSDLVSESGTNRDLGLEMERSLGRFATRLEAAHFDNRVQHLITLLPPSSLTFRNIGSAWLRGEEYSWRLANQGLRRRVALEGQYTHLRATDLGVDISWYAGKTLPGRPLEELFTRLSLGWGGIELGYELEHLGRNYLDRFNAFVVGRRELHAFDARVAWRGVTLQFAAHNLTGERTADVGGFPLPGRTLSTSVSYEY